MTKLMYKLRTRPNNRKGDQNWMEAIDLAKHKIIDPYKKAVGLEIAGRWNRLVKKMLHRDKMRSQKICIKWRRMVNDLLKVQRNRSLFIQAKFSRMIRSYITYRANRKKLQAVGRLRKLAMKLLRQDQIRMQRNSIVYTPMQRWEIVIQKVLFKIRHQSDGVDWKKGMDQARLQMNALNKTRSMNNIGRWKRFIDGILMYSNKHAK